jgi:hypothetical protein
VWTAVLLLIASGYSMVFLVFGGFAGAGLHVHLSFPKIISGRRRIATARTRRPLRSLELRRRLHCCAATTVIGAMSV